MAQTTRPSRPAGKPRTILFAGNSFTQGAHSAVKRYRANAVTDLNGDGYGGVPALFKTFTEESRLNYKVSLEAQGGKSLSAMTQDLHRATDGVRALPPPIKGVLPVGEAG